VTGKRSASTIACFLLALIVFAFAAAAGATTIAGHTTTLPYFYQEPDRNDAKSYLPIWQYSDFSANDMGVTGLNLYLYGWGRIDTYTRMDNDSIGDGDLAAGYIEYVNPEDLVTVRAGRQYISQGVTSSNVDGGYFMVSGWGFGLEGFGGVPVYTDYGTRAGDYCYGGRLFFRYKRYVELSASADSFYENRIPDNTHAGGEFRAWPIQQVMLDAHYYYDLIYNMPYDMKGSVRYRPIRDLQLLASYERLAPASMIGKTSIFSIFTFDNYRVGTGSVSYRYKERFEFSTAFSYVTFDDGSNAPKVDGGVAFFWGDHKQDAAGLDYRHLFDPDRGYDETRAYVMQSLTKKLTLGLDAMTTFLSESVNGVSTSFWGQASLEAKITDKFSIVGAGSISTNPYLTKDARGTLKIVYNGEHTFGQTPAGGVQR